MCIRDRLLTDSNKKYLERVFGCRVFDNYGCSEIGPIANSCERGNKHIFEDSVIVESIEDKDMKLGGKGRIIVTNLENEVMPLIRYDVGDIISVSDKACPCGRNTMTLEVFGREDEFIRVGGKDIGVVDIDKVLGGILGIDFYQIVQKGENLFNVNVVNNGEWESGTPELIRKTLMPLLGKRAMINIRPVSEIKPEKSGKFKLVKKE